MSTFASTSIVCLPARVRKLNHIILQLCCIGILLLFPICLSSQTESATLSGTITDGTGALVPNVQVTVTNQDTNISSATKTNTAGVYNVPGLNPGRYRVVVEKEGFKQVDVRGITLNVQDVISRNFTLEVGGTSETIQVDGSGASINTTDASVSTVIDRQFVENIPLNGRSFQSLIELTPGVIAVPGASTGSSGEFSVNGQRTETNNYMVDGVSANNGNGDLARVGGTPGVTALGTTQSLVSIDALQEFRISTSTYSAEFGRYPGAQISFQTRSGTNVMHGSAFDYFRNGVMDANNWFNDNAGLPKTAERQNDFGGTVGGPVRIPGLYNGKDKTFFFFSYEGLRLAVPQAAFTLDVPDTALRQDSPSALQPILNAFPIENGADQGNGLALFTGAYSSPKSLDAYSIRADHSFGDKLHIFGRYADTPSDSMARYIPANFACLENTTSDIKVLTIGTTSLLSPRMDNELRFNYTSNTSGTLYSQDNFGGAVPIAPALFDPGLAVLPKYYDFSAFLYYGTNPGAFVGYLTSPEHQWNITDSVSSTFGSHTLKYGIDYRRQVVTGGYDQLVNLFLYFSESEVLSNTSAIGLAETFGATTPVGFITNFSAFVQDEWRATNRLHLSLGLRWDLNPAPNSDPQPYTVNQITNLATTQLAPAGTPVWHTDYRGFAPRIGLAYQLRQKPGHETVVRSGFGVFYDTGDFFALYGTFGQIGVGSIVEYPNAAFPLTAAQQVLPPPSVASPYVTLVAADDPHLRLPYTLQWNVAVEQALGTKQTLTVSYVAAGGRKFLHAELLYPPTNPNFALGNGLYLTTGSSTSDYDSLQVQFQCRLSRGLQALASYTWSHAIDDLSNNEALSATLLRGNADFDVRHSFSAALTYEVPGSYKNPIAGALLKHYDIDLRQTARSALPVDIYSGYATLSNGQSVNQVPNLVPGVPVYLSTPSAPGGRVININAFSTPAANQNGDEPRNFARAFAVWQTDLAIRRDFPLHERLKLQFRAESFNIFNHPIFGNIDNFTTDGPTLFGRANNTLNESLGGLSSLYQMGGPRSLQLALKLIF